MLAYRGKATKPGNWQKGDAYAGVPFVYYQSILHGPGLTVQHSQNLRPLHIALLEQVKIFETWLCFRL
jgi:hypothetical protein